MKRIFSMLAIAGFASGCATQARTADGLSIIKRVNPIYPQQAIDQAIVGCTSVSFIVRPDGTADQYQIVESEPKGVFDQVTLKAINEWRFEPAPGRHTETIYYRLPGRSDGPKCGNGGAS